MHRLKMHPCFDFFFFFSFSSDPISLTCYSSHLQRTLSSEINHFSGTPPCGRPLPNWWRRRHGRRGRRLDGISVGRRVLPTPRLLFGLGRGRVPVVEHLRGEDRVEDKAGDVAV